MTNSIIGSATWTMFPRRLDQQSDEHKAANRKRAADRREAARQASRLDDTPKSWLQRLFAPCPVYALFLDIMVISSEDPDDLYAHRAQALTQAIAYNTGDTLDDFPIVRITHPDELAKIRRIAA